jgi:DNA-binding NarL/FixJ family response regulator
MFGEELERAISAAWVRLRDEILADPHELQRRLARRRAVHLNRPPRAWCIALRASDRRITPARWIIIPDHAMDRNHPKHPYEPIEHEVRIDARVLRRFCRPVRIGGETVAEVAEMLGVHRSTLRRGRHAVFFREHFYKNLGGKRGKPIPVIFASGPLDPAGGRFYAGPHAVWGSMWEHLPEMVPPEFEQAVVRRPYFKMMGNVRSDDPQFLGYRWVCPSCKKEVHRIYYPLAVRTLFHSWFRDPALKVKLTDADLLEPPAPTFACGRCHGVRHFSTLNPDAWNFLISHLTAGMLYGSEVEKPESFRPERKKARTRQVNRAAPRREQVLRRMMNGWTDKWIARDLMISLGRVWSVIRMYCKEEGVANRAELGKKLGWKHEQPLNFMEKARERRKRVMELWLEGLEKEEIARSLESSLANVKYDVNTIYREHSVKSRKELAEKMGVKLAVKVNSRREEIKKRVLAGLTNAEIAREMGMSCYAVGHECVKIYREEGVRGRRELMKKKPAEVSVTDR